MQREGALEVVPPADDRVHLHRLRARDGEEVQEVRVAPAVVIDGPDAADRLLGL